MIHSPETYSARKQDPWSNRRWQTHAFLCFGRLEKWFAVSAVLESPPTSINEMTLARRQNPSYLDFVQRRETEGIFASALRRQWHLCHIKSYVFSGSLTIHPVELADDGDYVCIATNSLGRSFSSVRSLIVSGKVEVDMAISMLFLLFVCTKIYLFSEFLERMIFPRIRNNLVNHSRFDLQHDEVNRLVCIADGYPEAEVAWIRGWLDLLLTTLSPTFVFLPYSQHPIPFFWHGISHAPYLNSITNCMEWIHISVKRRISMV